MASVNDKITDTRNSARPVSTTVSSARSPGGTTLACASLTGWATDSKVHFVTYQIDSNSDVVAGTQLDCYGIVSGNNINSFTVVDGTDNGNSTGDIVEMLPTSAWGQDLADGLTQEHNRDGTHSDITADTISTDTINEGTADTGVTIDGLLIKDSKLAEDNSVVTANVTDNAITANKLSTSSIFLGYAERTSSLAKSTTAEGEVTELANTVTIPTGPRKVKITVVFPRFVLSTATNILYVDIKNAAGTVVGGAVVQPTVDRIDNMTIIAYDGAASAGTETYKVYLTLENTNTFTFSHSATEPAFSLVEAM